MLGRGHKSERISSVWKNDMATFDLNPESLTLLEYINDNQLQIVLDLIKSMIQDAFRSWKNLRILRRGDPVSIERLEAIDASISI